MFGQRLLLWLSSPLPSEYMYLSSQPTYVRDLNYLKELLQIILLLPHLTLNKYYIIWYFYYAIMAPPFLFLDKYLFYFYCFIGLPMKIKWYFQYLRSQPQTIEQSVEQPNSQRHQWNDGKDYFKILQISWDISFSLLICVLNLRLYRKW